MEVFVMSVIITSWQLAGVSDFMVNAYCGGLSGVLATLAYFNIVTANDAQCFQLRAVVEAASWLLVAASLILAASSHFVVTASMQKTLDEHAPIERRLFTDRWSKDSGGGAEEAQSPEEMEGADKAKDVKSKVSPIPPRYTDYYKFAIWTEHIADEEAEAAATNEVGEEAAGVATTGYVSDKVTELATPPEHITSSSTEIVAENVQCDEIEVPEG